MVSNRLIQLIEHAASVDLSTRNSFEIGYWAEYANMSHLIALEDEDDRGIRDGAETYRAEILSENGF